MVQARPSRAEKLLFKLKNWLSNQSEMKKMLMNLWQTDG
jgi:hypothetical protein